MRVRFEPSQPWDWTVPGLVYDKIKADFPKKREQNVMRVELRAEQEEIAQSVKGGIARMQFLREDERALIQVGPDLLAVNHLKPHPTWPVFKEMIVRGLSVYREVAKPKALRRVGLRYINRIEIPEEQIMIEDYLLAVPKIPDSVPQFFATWVQRVEIPYEQANGILVLQSGSLREVEQKEVAFLLDLDFITLHAEAVTIDSATEWIERAHDEEERAFEACITPKSRTLFKEVLHDR